MNNEEKKIIEEEKNIIDKSKNQMIKIPKYKSFNDKRHTNDYQKVNNINIFNDNKILSLIFFKKYKPLNIIGEGTYSVVYEGINIKDKTKVALKIEKKNSKISLLKEEAYTIFNLKGYGIIKFISYGHTKDYNILVEPLLGKSLYTLYLETKKSFTLIDICLIAIQCLDRIEYIHSKGYIHGDIKPENFIIGLNDPRIIYIIDFGLSKKYRSDRTGRHIQFCITKKMTGTARYASTNSLRGVQISRRDDLESLAYMIIYFIMKKLPWQGVKANTQQNRYKKIYYMKKKIFQDESFKGLPIEIQNFYRNIKKLNFDEEPNYSILKGYFKDLLEKNNLNDNETFSWIKDKSLIEAKTETNLRTRKSNSQKRLMDKLMKNSNNVDKSFEEKKIEGINSLKKNTNTKNIIINNDCIYNSNNKEIKSINEAIIDVGDFSDNEDENKINNIFKENKKLRKNNSEVKKRQPFNKVVNVDILGLDDNVDNFIIKEYKSNNNFINNINKEKIEDNKDYKYSNLYDSEIKKYTSFREKPNNLKYHTEYNKPINKEKKDNNYNRCNIGKNYIINEMKLNKNNLKNNNLYMCENKKVNINYENINVNQRRGNLSQKKVNKRSKSGEKCLIQ